MIKLLAIFSAGILETFVNTAYLISVEKRKVYLATVLEFLYSLIYLFIVAYALQDANTFELLIAYAGGCSLGTFWQMKRQKKQ